MSERKTFLLPGEIVVETKSLRDWSRRLDELVKEIGDVRSSQTFQVERIQSAILMVSKEIRENGRK